MKKLSQVVSWASVLLIALWGPNVLAQNGAQHFEFPFQVGDYIECMDEDVLWDAVIYETYLEKQTPSGQGFVVDNWRWESTVEGVESGNLWYTRGTAPYVATYSLNNSMTGGYIALENSVLQPVTPGLPRIKLTAFFRLQYNADGELKVDTAQYTYTCLND